MKKSYNSLNATFFNMFAVIFTLLVTPTFGSQDYFEASLEAAPQRQIPQCRSKICDDRPECPKSSCQCLFASRMDCAVYYQCLNGKPIQYRCSPGLLFNEESMTCDYSYNVNCSSNTTDESPSSTDMMNTTASISETSTIIITETSILNDESNVTTSLISTTVTDAPSSTTEQPDTPKAITTNNPNTETVSTVNDSTTVKETITETSETRVSLETTTEEEPLTIFNTSVTTTAEATITTGKTEAASTSIVTTMDTSTEESTTGTTVKLSSLETTTEDSHVETTTPPVPITSTTSATTENTNGTSSNTETTIHTSTVDVTTTEITAKVSSPETTTEGSHDETTTSSVPVTSTTSIITESTKETSTYTETAIDTSTTGDYTAETTVKASSPEITSKDSHIETTTSNPKTSTILPTTSESTITERLSSTTDSEMTSTTIKESTTVGELTTTVISNVTGTSSANHTTEASVTDTTTLEPLVNFECPSRFGLFPDPDSCRRFYQCSHWVPYQKLCPSNLYFNPNLQVCDWPYRAGCVLNTTIEPTPSPETSNRTAGVTETSTRDNMKTTNSGDKTTTTKNSPTTLNISTVTELPSTETEAPVTPKAVTTNNTETVSTLSNLSTITETATEISETTTPPGTMKPTTDEEPERNLNTSNTPIVETSAITTNESSTTLQTITDLPTAEPTTELTTSATSTEVSTAVPTMKTSAAEPTVKVTTQEVTTEDTTTEKPTSESQQAKSTTILVDSTTEPITTTVGTDIPTIEGNLTTTQQHTTIESTPDFTTLASGETTTGSSPPSTKITTITVSIPTSSIFLTTTTGKLASTSEFDMISTTPKEDTANGTMTIPDQNLTNISTTVNRTIESISTEGTTAEPQSEFECPTRFGLFPDPKTCRGFYHCSHWVPYHKWCPSDLHFNPNLKVCDWPYRAGCGEGPTDPTKLPDDAGKDTLNQTCDCDCCFLPNTKDCSKYFLCLDNYMYDGKCAEGLLFNSLLQNCDLAERVTCKEDSPRCLEPNGLFPKPEDCSSFYRCSNGTPKVESCPPGIHFSADKDQCVKPCEAKCDKSYDCTSTSSTSNLKTSTYSSICLEPDGLYPVQNDCTSFYFCWNGRPEKLSCPPGLHYNKEYEVCEYPCDANCDADLDCSPTNTVLSTPSLHCADAEGLYPVKDDCTAFYLCSNGKEHLIHCPPGSHYGVKIETCDDPCVAKCNTSFTCTSSPKAESSTDDPVSPECPEGNGLFRNPEDCESFYQCTNGRSQLIRCPTGLHFNLADSACEKPCVAGCDKNAVCPTEIPDMERNCTCEGCYLPDPSDCSAYFFCSNSTLTKGYCSISQLFDKESNSCKDQNTVDCEANGDPSMCPETFGYFPYPGDCKKFIHCEDVVAHVKECSISQEFDPLDKVCTKPKGRCGNITIDSHCPEATGLFAYPGNCSLFYHCEQGVAYVKQCHSPLMFNSVQEVCDWPKNVNCGKDNSTSSRPTVATTTLISNYSAPNSTQSTVISSISSTMDPCHKVPGVICPCACRVPTYDDCSSFYQCQEDGTACKKYCPEGLYFNKIEMICDLPTNLKCRDFFYAAINRAKHFSHQMTTQASKDNTDLNENV